MSEFSQSVRRSLKKYQSMMIAFGVIFGLRAEDFLSQLWKTGSLSEAWASWVVHGIPEIPANLIILAILFALLIGWNVLKDSEKGGYGERTDGYRPAGSDD